MTRSKIIPTQFIESKFHETLSRVDANKLDEMMNWFSMSAFWENARVDHYSGISVQYKDLFFVQRTSKSMKYAKNLSSDQSSTYM